MDGRSSVSLLAYCLDRVTGDPPNRWHPVAWQGRAVFFASGPIDDNDWTYVNGKLVGKTTFDENPKADAVDRRYTIPEALLKFGQKNSLVIRVFDKWGAGGVMAPVSIEPDKSIVVDSWSPYIDGLDLYDVDAFHNW